MLDRPIFFFWALLCLWPIVRGQNTLIGNFPGVVSNDSQLIWGFLNNTNYISQLTAIVSAARTAASTVFTAVATFDGSTNSNNALNRLPILVQQAICARMTNDSSCMSSVTQGLLVWAITYTPTGSGNDINMYSWFQAYDLMRPVYVNRQDNVNVSIMDNFVRIISTRTDQNYAASLYPDVFRVQRIFSKSFAAVILANQTDIAIAQSYISGTCTGNLRSDGRTRDYFERDSLGQHIRVLLLWVQMFLQLPRSLMSTTCFQRLELACNFLQQYVNGSRVQQEYQFSTTSSDNTQKALNLSWVPSTSFSFLIQADILFWSVYDWTSVPPPIIPRTTTTANTLVFATLRDYFDVFPIFTKPNRTTNAQESSTTTTTAIQATTTSMPTTTPTQTTSTASSNLILEQSSTPAPTTTPAPPVRMGSQFIRGNLTEPALNVQLAAAITAGLIASATPFTAVNAISSSNSTSNTATNRLSDFFLVCVCARYARNLTCRASAIQGLLVWANTFVDVGNDASPLKLYIEGYDLVRPYLLESSVFEYVVVTVDAFLRRLTTPMDASYSSGSTSNIFAISRVFTRVIASVALNDQSLLQSARALINFHFARNIYSDGTTYDYVWRDSLAQHIRVLTFWVQMVTLAPQMFSKDQLSSIERACNFLQAFIKEGVLKYEYAQSTYSSDNTAKAANTTYVPAASFSFLIQADIVFASVYAWTIKPPPITRTVTTLTNLTYAAWQTHFNKNNILSDRAGSPKYRTGRLKWGDIFNQSHLDDLTSIIDVPASRAVISYPVLAQFTGNATVWLQDPSDARTIAYSSLENLTYVAMCARFWDPVIFNCVQTISQNLLAWAVTYDEAANVDDNNYLLALWIRAYDLVRPTLFKTLLENDILTLDEFLSSFLVYDQPIIPDQFAARSLYLYGVAAVASDNDTHIQRAKLMTEQLAGSNLFSNGTSYDFVAHGSLNLHIRNLLWWARLMTAAPQILSMQVRALIEANANFLRRFTVPPVQVFVEYSTHSVGSAFDEAQRLLNRTWVPESNYWIMTEVNCLFPSMYNWSSFIPRSSNRAYLFLQRAMRYYWNDQRDLNNPAFVAKTTRNPVWRPSQLVHGEFNHPSLIDYKNSNIASALAKIQSSSRMNSVDYIHITGTINSPGLNVMYQGKEELDSMYSLGLCANAGVDECLNFLADGLLRWADVYVPIGSSVDETSLSGLMIAYDLSRPLLFYRLTLDQISQIDAFIRKIFFRYTYNEDEAIFITHEAVASNWFGWETLVRSYAAQVIGDADMIESFKLTVNSRVLDHIFPDGSTVDFYTRDALDYHVYGLEGYMSALIRVPSMFSLQTASLLESACNFLQPYINGSKIHIEFLNTQNDFDIERKLAGIAIFQNKPYDPKHAFTMLRYARVIFPSVYQWAKPPLIDESQYQYFYAAMNLTYGARGIRFNTSGFPPLDPNRLRLSDVYYMNKVAEYTPINTTVPVGNNPPIWRPSQLLIGNITSPPQLSNNYQFVLVNGVSRYQTAYLPAPVINSTFQSRADNLAFNMVIGALAARYARCSACTPFLLEGFRAWSSTYVPSPLQNLNFQVVPLFRAYDIMRPIMDFQANASLIAQMDQFLYSFLPVIDTSIGDAVPDRFKIQGLHVRAIISKILADDQQILFSRDLIRQILPVSIRSDGRSYDLLIYDSMDRHIATLDAWIELLMYAPDMIPSQAHRRLLEGALNYIEPFWNSKVSRIEFYNYYSTSRADFLERLKLVPFQNIMFRYPLTILQLGSAFPSARNIWITNNVTTSGIASSYMYQIDAFKIYYDQFLLLSLAEPNVTVVLGSTPQVTTSTSSTRPTSTTQAVVKVFKVKVVLTFRIAAQIILSNTTLQRNIKEAIAVSAGLTKTDYLRVELIIRASLTRRRRALLQSSNNSVIDAVINMPNASIANASATQITNASLNSALADVGLPPVVGMQAPVVEEVVVIPETTTSAIPVSITPENAINSSSVEMGSTWAVLALILGVAVTFGVIGASCGRRRSKPKKTSPCEHKREIPIPIRPPRMPDPDDEKHTRLPDKRWPNRDGYDRVPKEPESAWDVPRKLILPNLPRRSGPEGEDGWDVPVP